MLYPPRHSSVSRWLGKPDLLCPDLPPWPDPLTTAFLFWTTYFNFVLLQFSLPEKWLKNTFQVQTSRSQNRISRIHLNFSWLTRNKQKKQTYNAYPTYQTFTVCSGASEGFPKVTWEPAQRTRGPSCWEFWRSFFLKPVLDVGNLYRLHLIK